MDIDDAESIALLVVIRRQHQSSVKPDGDQDAGRPGNPGQQPAGNPIRMRWRGELVDPGERHGHREWHHQEPEQEAAATKAQRERRADCAERAEFTCLASEFQRT
jgi:hypothetical protein